MAQFENYIIPHIAQMRDRTIRLIQTLRKRQKYLVNYSPFSYQSYACYACKIKAVDPDIIKRSSIMMQKFALFVEDLIFFKPKEEESLLAEIKESIKGKKGYTLNEVSFF